MATEEGRKLVLQMVRTAEQTRTGFEAGDVSTVAVSSNRDFLGGKLPSVPGPRVRVRDDLPQSLHEAERPIVAEYYQRAIGRSLDRAARSPWRRSTRTPNGNEGTNIRRQL
jgi:cobaltochelatase CobS